MGKRKKKKPVRGANFMMIDVDNPLYSYDHEESRSNPRKITAMMNVRESPAAWMHIHGQLKRYQFEAASIFRALFERSMGNELSAMDYTKDPVDGGGYYDPFTDTRQRAHKELVQVSDKLGPAGYALVTHVCGEGRWISDEYAKTRSHQNIAAKHLRECLDTLAIFWGLINITHPKRDRVT